jgi:hypothetical protein
MREKGRLLSHERRAATSGTNMNALAGMRQPLAIEYDVSLVGPIKPSQ